MKGRKEELPWGINICSFPYQTIFNGRALGYKVSREKCCACYCSLLGLQGGAGVWAIYVLEIHMETRKVFRRAGHFLAAQIEGGWPVFTCCYTGWRRPLFQPQSPAQTATQHCWASGHSAGRCTLHMPCSVFSLLTHCPTIYICSVM